MAVRSSHVLVLVSCRTVSPGENGRCNSRLAFLVLRSNTSRVVIKPRTSLSHFRWAVTPCHPTMATRVRREPLAVDGWDGRKFVR